MDIPLFESFSKIARLSRQCIITEKLDGTNGVISIGVDGSLYVGSKNKWIYGDGVPVCPDNHGFATWCVEHKDELIAGLGVGRHYGEWWGSGIQRTYGLQEKRFSLFNVTRWKDKHPVCCSIVPVLFEGLFHSDNIDVTMCNLQSDGSQAAPGFMQPEGVVIYHCAGNNLFKKTFKNDEAPKTLVNE